MVRKHVKSLQQLERLSILYRPSSRITLGEPLTELLLALEESYWDLPLLSDLDVQLVALSVGRAVDWVRRLGTHCPAVISYSGHLGIVSPVSLS